MKKKKHAKREATVSRNRVKPPPLLVGDFVGIKDPLTVVKKWIRGG